MAETLVTRRQAREKAERPTGALHVFRLRPRKALVLEVEDLHFHHDSAVLLPDYEAAPNAPDGTGHQDRVTGLAVLRACYLHAKKNPAQKTIITGHTDTTGAASYNLGLSQMRADNVLYVLLGERDKWAKIAQDKHKVEDYQLILKWIARVNGWDCDPGPVDNQAGPQTQGATKKFQQRYNQEFNASIAEDGAVGPQTWKAFFDVYIQELKEMLKTDDAGLAVLRQNLHFLNDARKTVGCGEHNPIEASRFDNYRSSINRRVEIIFFDPGEEPQMQCHPGANSCAPEKCEIYNPQLYQFKHIPVEPITPVGAASPLILLGGKETAPAAADATAEVETQPDAAPTIGASPNAVVKKPYTNPARFPIVLKTDALFDGTGKFECSPKDRILFFPTSTSAAALKFDGKDNVFQGGPLSSPGGVTLFAEGVKASDKVDDVELKLTLTGGTVKAGPPDTAKMTAVELTLDLCESRTKVGVDPQPLPQPTTAAAPPGTPKDKLFGGRFIHAQDAAKSRHRAMLIVKIKPEKFKADLLLRRKDALINIFKAEDPKSADPALTGKIVIPTSTIPAGGLKLFAEGKTASAALRDADLQLGFDGAEPDGDRAAITVYKIDKIEAKLRATPCKRDGTKADGMAAKSSTADSKTFDATAITVVRECGDLKLTATASPATVPLTWAVERAADDTGLAGLPSHNDDGGDKKRLLKTDATGSFHMMVFVDTNGGGKRDLEEDGITLNVNMVNVEVLAGAANNQVIKRTTTYNDTKTTASTLVVHSSTTFGIVPAVNASYTDAEFTKYALSAKVTIKLTGGGANQRRGVDKIGVGYIQTTTADSVTGTYADGRTVKEKIAVNAALPSPITSGTPPMLAFPVLDTGAKSPPSDRNTGPFINSSSDNDKTDLPAGGQQRIVRYLEPPAIVLPKKHPVTNSVLASISGSNDFAMFLSAFSKEFDENYTVIASGAWSLTYGTYSAAGGWTNAGAVVTAPSALTVHTPPKRGESTDVERCQPNFVDNIKLDAR